MLKQMLNNAIPFTRRVEHATQTTAAAAGRPSSLIAPSLMPRPGLMRRALAEAIDRLVPLPFIALIFPRWIVVVVVYHLLCDCAPARRSFGKWVCRLRVVRASAATPCEWWRAALRRTGSALSQTAWCLWMWIPAVLIWELGSLACVLLNPEGRRPEDFLAGTRVVTEKAFRHRGRQSWPHDKRGGTGNAQTTHTI